jgi:ubiquinone/menaquinone biosynthesis C-methylase UbiE
VRTDRTDRWQRAWDKHSRRYDREMGFWDRHLFKDSRTWVCGQASGKTLEVAIGTGLNLTHYPREVTLTGLDFSPAMLALARQRAADLGVDVELREGDARELDLADASFETVVCTFGLCAIPEPERAIAEMVRVLRPDGTLLLADHIEARSRLARGVQRVLELGTVPLEGEHFRRRPARTLETLDVTIERQERFGPVGIVERLAARKAG